jgi:hypothetical protein
MNHPSAGGAATQAQLAYARQVAAARTGQLANVRAAAAKWQTGLAGLTGTIAIFGLVKGSEDVDALASPWGAVYGVCLALALTCSIGGGVLAMRAAFGLPKATSTAWDPGRATSDGQEARVSARLLWGAIALTVASIAGLAAALAVAWYAPDVGAPKLRVHSVSGSEDCGSVQSVARDALVLRTGTGERTIALSDIDGLAPEDSCSGG